MPAVTAGYRTTKDAAAVGESLAGLFVVETFLLEPDLFGTYAAVDPSPWWDGGKLVAGAGKRLRARPDVAAAVYLATGGEPEVTALTRRLADALAADAPRGVRWHRQELPDETHATVFHPAASRAFRWAFKPPAGKKP